MNGKPVLAAVSAALLFTTACAARPGATMRNNNLNSAIQPQRLVRLSTQNNQITSTQIGGLMSACESIYAAADRGDMRTCGNLAATLRTQWNDSKNIMLAPLTQAGQSNAVDSAMSQLSAAIAVGNAYNVKKCANKIFLDLSNISSTYNPSKTAGVNTVKYYTREVALACQKNDLATAKADCSQLVRYWNGVKATANDPTTQRLVNSVNRSVGSKNLKQASSYCSALNGSASALVNDMLSRRA
jgi:hypothetical protein